jgi:hypothetical protein
MKLCKDCKHLEAHRRCAHPKNMEKNPVTGERDFKQWNSAGAQRVGFFSAYLVGTCGIQARRFEPKEAA